jgi:cold shock CspA family protein
MSMMGKISQICWAEEYALIRSFNDELRVLVDAYEFGADWPSLVPGTAVKFCSLPGARGPRAYNVTILSAVLESPTRLTVNTRYGKRPPTSQ